MPPWLPPEGFGAAYWLVAGLALAGAELLLPGAYLIFIAAGPLASALAVWLFAPALAGQLLVTAGAALAACLAGVQLYRRSRAGGQAARRLNSGFDWLIGQNGAVAEAISGGQGRVQIAGGAFPATGPDLPAGQVVRVVAVEAGVLRVLPLD